VDLFNVLQSVSLEIYVECFCGSEAGRDASMPQRCSVRMIIQTVMSASLEFRWNERDKTKR
jgi:hypothetical protein